MTSTSLPCAGGSTEPLSSDADATPKKHSRGPGHEQPRFDSNESPLPALSDSPSRSPRPSSSPSEFGNSSSKLDFNDTGSVGVAEDGFQSPVVSPVSNSPREEDPNDADATPKKHSRGPGHEQPRFDSNESPLPALSDSPSRSPRPSSSPSEFGNSSSKLDFNDTGSVGVAEDGFQSPVVSPASDSPREEDPTKLKEDMCIVICLACFKSLKSKPPRMPKGALADHNALGKLDLLLRDIHGSKLKFPISEIDKHLCRPVHVTMFLKHYYTYCRPQPGISKPERTRILQNRCLVGQAYFRVLDTPMLAKSLPWNTDEYAFLRVVLTGAFTNKEQALILRAHVVSKQNVRAILSAYRLYQPSVRQALGVKVCNMAEEEWNKHLDESGRHLPTVEPPDLPSKVSDITDPLAEAFVKHGLSVNNMIGVDTLDGPALKKHVSDSKATDNDPHLTNREHVDMHGGPSLTISNNDLAKGGFVESAHIIMPEKAELNDQTGLVAVVLTQMGQRTEKGQATLDKDNIEHPIEDAVIDPRKFHVASSSEYCNDKHVSWWSRVLPHNMPFGIMENDHRRRPMGPDLMIKKFVLDAYASFLDPESVCLLFYSMIQAKTATRIFCIGKRAYAGGTQAAAFANITPSELSEAAMNMRKIANDKDKFGKARELHDKPANHAQAYLKSIIRVFSNHPFSDEAVKGARINGFSNIAEFGMASGWLTLTPTMSAMAIIFMLAIGPTKTPNDIRAIMNDSYLKYHYLSQNPGAQGIFFKRFLDVFILHGLGWSLQMQAPLKSGGFYGIVSCWEYAVECNSVQHLHVHMLFWLARFGSLFRRFNNQTSKEAREAREKLAADLQNATVAAMRDLGIYEVDPEVAENQEPANLDLPNPASPVPSTPPQQFSPYSSSPYTPPPQFSPASVGSEDPASSPQSPCDQRSTSEEDSKNDYDPPPIISRSQNMLSLETLRDMFSKNAGAASMVELKLSDETQSGILVSHPGPSTPGHPPVGPHTPLPPLTSTPVIIIFIVC